MKVNTNYKKPVPVPLYDICLGEMFEYRPMQLEDEFNAKDKTPIDTPLIRVGANNNIDVKDGYLLAINPYNGYIYMIPRDKEVIPLEGELNVKK